MSCHSKEKHQFTLFSQHPVLSGAMNCTDCHDYFKSLSADLTSKLNNQTCYKCHGEMDGPFMHEHEATRDFGVENGGCINCHSPHGSPFANLLKEPTPQLCQQCHAIPHPDSPHGNEYANINCMDCHTDIHGSDDNKSLIESGQYSNLITNCRECHHRP
jgi:DmsE family decaheme c-type cytochrome